MRTRRIAAVRTVLHVIARQGRARREPDRCQKTVYDQHGVVQHASGFVTLWFVDHVMLS